MADWNHDISKAPRGKYRVVPAGKGDKSTRKVFERQEIIAAGPHGTVCVSYFIPEQARWNMFTAENGPIAWQPYAGRREYLDEKGRTRYAIDLPAHPTMATSWFQDLLAERRAA